MELILQRIAQKRDYTIGRLSIANEIGLARFCDTLEPPVVANNRNQPKAVPAGRYAVAVTWSPHFRRWLPLLLHVPYREGIRIHAGNTVHDTAGCILVGQNLVVGKVLNSASTLDRLMQRIRGRADGEPLYITIQG
ncbi:MAG: hypothetical protein IJ767_07680 [Bacteroidaceae bacterium]|nr:hypothetical protein [Bacteroidaceae bacterium]MBR1801349.1 hypothetical protein [Bacteroidaceae bacterium]